MRATAVALGSIVRHVADRGALLVQAHDPVTPEDHAECLPATLASGAILLFDGRIDNRDELRRALHVDSAMSDGALVAAALERWGDDAPCHLFGDFALAAWQPDARRLLLAADAVGGRTVFYHATPERVAFSTLVTGLRVFPDVPRDVDDDALVRFLHLQLPAGERSFFRGVRRLPVGGRLVWRDGAARVDCHTSLDWDATVRLSSDDEYVDAAREHLDRAVGACMRLSGPVICQLSGGLDSGGVSATAARLHAPSTVHTVTVSPDPSVRVPQRASHVTDEWPQAERVAAAHPNIVAHRVFASDAPDRTLDPVDFMRAVGEPLARPTQLPWFLSGHVTVHALGGRALLAGGAGNGVLSWHAPHALGDMGRDGRWRTVGQTVVAHARRTGVASGWSMVKGQLIAEFLPPSVGNRLRRPAGPPVRPPLARDVVASGRELPRIVFDDLRPAPGPRRDARLRRFLVERHLSGRAFYSALRRLNGVEWRDPYADLRLLQLCLAIPAEQYMAAGLRRSLARRTLADRMPATVLHERRRGRQSADWFARMTARRDSIMADLDRMRSSSRVAAIVDVAALRKIAEAWPADAVAAERRMMELLYTLTLGIAAGQFIEWAAEPHVPPRLS